MLKRAYKSNIVVVNSQKKEIKAYLHNSGFRPAPHLSPEPENVETSVGSRSEHLNGAISQEGDILIPTCRTHWEMNI